MSDSRLDVRNARHRREDRRRTRVDLVWLTIGAVLVVGAAAWAATTVSISSGSPW